MVSVVVRWVIIEVKSSIAQIARFMGPTRGPTWVLVAPGGPHIGPMNFAVRNLPVLSK